MIKKFFNREKGITGLETAIILIAFVVVAAVFAYTVLSAGLFATQKSQEAVYSGLQEAQSTLELRGGVLAKAHATGDDGTVAQVIFTVSNVLGGDPIDFTPPEAHQDNNGTANTTTSNNKVIINYIDDYQQVNDLYWTITKLGNSDEDNLLEANEKFEINVGSTSNGTSGGNLYDALSANRLGINRQFDIEVLTPAGAVLSIERTIPAYIDNIMNLH